MKPFLSKADATATLKRRGYDPLGKWLPGSKGGWRVQAVTPEGSIAWVEIMPGGPGGHPKVVKRNPPRRNPLSHHADTIARLARDHAPEDLRAQAERADEAATYYQRTGDARKAAWERERAAVLRAAVARIQSPGRANPMRKNHHIRQGGTFYTPGGRKGTVLGKASMGSYPVRWKDGTFGRVEDSEKAAYPTEGSRMSKKRKNPQKFQKGDRVESTGPHPMRGVVTRGEYDPGPEYDTREVVDVRWTENTRGEAVRIDGTGTKTYWVRKISKNPRARKRNPTPVHRIDTDRNFDRRTGKRAEAQVALRRIQKANDLGFHLDHRGWYQQPPEEHFIEMVGSGGRDAMARGSRHRKYVDAATARRLNDYVAGKGRL